MAPTKKKRQETARRAIVYIVMVTVVTSVTALLVFLMLGYRLNRDTGEIQQGGLVQFISQPTGARVTVGEAKLANTTRSKITLNPGRYKVLMERDRYKAWEKDIEVKSGAVLWLNSARLIPNEPKTDAIFTADTIDSAAMETGGKEVAVLADKKKPEITLVTMNSDTTQTRTVAIPASLLGSEESYECALDRWLDNNRHLLVRCNDSRGERWLVVDIDRPEASISLPEVNNKTVKDIKLDPQANNRLYVLYEDGVLIRLSVADGSYDATTITNAQSFSLSSNGTILYASKPANSFTIVGYATSYDAEPRALRTLATDQNVLVAGGTYFDEFYLTIANGKTMEVLRYSELPETDIASMPDTLTEFETANSPIALGFRAENRFMYFQSSDEVVVYDAELGALARTPLLYENETPKNVTWTDEYHYMAVIAGKLRQYEFDGTNQTDIVSSRDGFPSAYSANNRYLYSVGTTQEGRHIIQRTRLILQS